MAKICYGSISSDDVKIVSLIPPSDYEFKLMAELNNLKQAMGLSFQDQPNPF